MPTLEVRRDDLRTSRLAGDSERPLAEGAARLRPVLLAMTANTLTYAVAGGPPFGYFDFFPAADGWGRPPAWGFAVVEASRADGVSAGERVWGYFPLGTTLDVVVAESTPAGFLDASAHRRDKAKVYNQYLRVGADPAYVAGREAEQCLFRPMFGTGWWVADRLDRSVPRPATVIISSASSKTALATAQQARRRGGFSLVGLTSPGNRDYVASTGLYDRVATYDEAETLTVEGPATFVDYLGRVSVLTGVHRRLRGVLTESILIGATAWDANPEGLAFPTGEIEGVAPEFFFAPTYVAGRLAEEGPSLADALTADMIAFYSASSAWVTPTWLDGLGAAEGAWKRLCDGAVPPREGLVLRLGGAS